jgi:RNA polymerase sigma-70 factor, ECF subfamily
VVWTIVRRFAPASDAGWGEAREAAQEIFVDLWKHAGRYDPKLGSEQAFVAMLARRRMIDRLRRAEQRPALVPVPETLAGEELVALERCAEAEIAAGVLAPLDPHQRRALSLAIGQAMTHGQIAELTGMPLATVKSLIRRALVAVRKRVLAQQGAQ